MVKSELVSMLNQKFPGLNETDVALAMDCILGQMKDALAQGSVLKSGALAVFSIRHRPPRIARNPKTGESVNLPSKVAMHFKPGKEMRELVKYSLGSLGRASFA